MHTILDIIGWAFVVLFFVGTVASFVVTVAVLVDIVQRSRKTF